MKYALITIMCVLSTIVPMQGVTVHLKIIALLIILLIGITLGVWYGKEETLLNLSLASINLRLAEIDVILNAYKKEHPLSKSAEDEINAKMKEIASMLEYPDDVIFHEEDQ